MPEPPVLSQMLKKAEWQQTYSILGMSKNIIYISTFGGDISWELLKSLQL